MMFRPRIIPVLLLKGNGLVKSQGFLDHKYVGDPINAVKILNDLKADELVFLDIEATSAGRPIPSHFIRDVGEEATMPFAVGGGLNQLESIREALNAGAERVIIGERAATDPNFIQAASREFGSSSIIVCMDVKRDFLARTRVWYRNGAVNSGLSPIDFARMMESSGAGELIVQSIDRDGTQKGYDVPLLKEVSEAVSIPVIALGGAANLEHMTDVYNRTSINGLAAGSMFVFHGEYRSVLISYPSRAEIRGKFEKASTIP